MKYDIKFIEDPHGYEVNGSPVPSVTEIMNALGVIDFSSVPEHNLLRAQERGTAVHIATHYLDEDDLEWSTVEERYIPFIKAYQRFKEIADYEVLEIEKVVYNPDFGYAGTIDRICKINGELSIIDLKTGGVPKSVGLQTAAYSMAAVWSGYDIQKRYCLNLKANGKPNLKECANLSDHGDFMHLTYTFRTVKTIKQRRLS